MFCVYFLVSESKDKTYVGFTGNLKRRITEHLNQKTKTTKNFGNFKYFILDETANLKEARIREKYWKSCAGRKKIKILFATLGK